VSGCNPVHRPGHFLKRFACDHPVRSGAAPSATFLFILAASSTGFDLPLLCSEERRRGNGCAECLVRPRLTFNSPKCRLNHDMKIQPKFYDCYCGKMRGMRLLSTSNLIADPPYNAWLLPHSCGERCERELMLDGNKCGHVCLLLCHPGPCPPCAVMIPTHRCYCGAQSAARRCSTRDFSCNGICYKPRTCKHACHKQCHPGACPPCAEVSLLKFVWRILTHSFSTVANAEEINAPLHVMKPLGSVRRCVESLLPVASTHVSVCVIQVLVANVLAQEREHAHVARQVCPP
jgi:hypothetical protein